MIESELAEDKPRFDDLERLMIAAAQKAFNEYTLGGDRLMEGEARAILAAVTKCMSDYAEKTGRSYVP